MNPDGSTENILHIVTDSDRESAADDGKTWQALIRQGKLRLSKDRRKAKIKWDLWADHNLAGKLNIKSRGMELSELTVFHGRVLTVDDRTGMVYEIRGNDAIPWVFLNSGPGNTTEGFKAEWMTIKDDLLYVGSHGNEWRGPNGEVVHENNMWVKTISRSGAVKHHDWRKIFDKIRNACGIRKPGYLTHEAVQYSEIRKTWFFLPRKASKTAYDEPADERKGTNFLIVGDRHLKRFRAIKYSEIRKTWFFLPRKASKTAYDEPADERKGTNFLIVGDQHLKRFRAIKIGRLTDPTRGFSAFDFVPGTDDFLIAALKTREVAEEPLTTYFTVFDINGKVILADEEIEGNLKFEGLFFV
ncbi:unnamed protein product [Nippostrongylus brasiliensis]|uniref:Soluble calcium-activated nucleotidase 1 (inferred by orthology to a human protein) n=1 Tax=Nippostrongylus brasiliensis TaxID=27835 RepID=A0A0N4YPP1_NIPBR|nr:unnamed protein product [Nippostrongylus brasiliensis]